ncbi:MAG: UDP-glucose 4-epimerase GalE [Bdellovibrionota bacterium]
MKETILVVGGAGYIGSQVVSDLLNEGYNPIILDNFIYGNRDIAEKIGAPIETGDMLDTNFLRYVFNKYKISVVMHFAAYAYVGESVISPLKYYKNNVVATLNLLTIMKEFNVKKFIFSSTCATYGVPKVMPITEQTPQNPINPYGKTKLMVEQILKDFDVAYDFKSIIFRYFNVSGANKNGKMGERHSPETHIIPLAIGCAMEGGVFKVFGDDYDTLDGTCIRDYIHVADISSAHILGMKKLLETNKSEVYNIGTGSGSSVLEILNAIEKISGKKVKRECVKKREGDPPKLVADAKKIKDALGWEPKNSNIENIIKTAWDWHNNDIKNKNNK